jgi:hypothetical protein
LSPKQAFPKQLRSAAAGMLAGVKSTKNVAEKQKALFIAAPYDRTAMVSFNLSLD